MFDVRNFALRDEKAMSTKFLIKNSIFKALSKLQTGAKDQIEDYQLQGLWDKKGAYFQGMKTSCQSIRALFKVSLEIDKIFTVIFFSWQLFIKIEKLERLL
jgi:hypothetical protein